LVASDDPFLEHGFLSALESSRSVGSKAGCLPRFVLVRDNGRLVGAVPLYLKMHSYGEFIFDWAWADAAHRVGIEYYPKLVSAVPFTPATGQRLLVLPGAPINEVRSRLLLGVQALADTERVSSVHFLFCTGEEAQALADDSSMPYVPRLSMQYHWSNRLEQPFGDFEDYLSAFKSRHRKQIRKERAVVNGYGLTLRTAVGSELDAADWQALQRFYATNVARHQGIEYLQPAFFECIRATFSHRLVATLAYAGDRAIAGTINFEKGKHLYGRYWGCDEHYEELHFELCYHRLIERAIERRLTHFEAGAQGEHKLKRGLEPRYTYSAHWIRHPMLASAIQRFIVAERVAVAEQLTQLSALSPFHSPESSVSGGPAQVRSFHS
jgi:uncharacterized protein